MHSLGRTSPGHPAASGPQVRAAEWSGTAAIRLEAHYGDRIVPCFAEQPRSIAELLIGAAGDCEREALVDADARLTWGGVLDTTRRLAGGLAARGIGPGDRVALLVGNNSQFA